MKKKSPTTPVIRSFGFEAGQLIGDNYEVVSLLGRGWEAEVYRLCERDTKIERAGKFFFPHRNIRNRAARIYARKLHKLRNFPILIQYHTSDSFQFQGQRVTFLLSEYVEGEPLSSFLKRQQGKRISAFQGLHLLHALAKGMEGIHNAREYHGDLHTGNIIIRRFGISFDLKVLDMYHYGPAQATDFHDDVCDLIRIFYDAIGGPAKYASHPPQVKAICCGLKRSLILRKFRTAGQLRQSLETLEWK
jgi:serine/threonine protein kinase